MEVSWNEVAHLYAGAEEIDNLWNLSDDLSITDAAALIAGYNPTMVERALDDAFFERAFPRYVIALKSLRHAILNNRLNAAVRHSARGMDTRTKSQTSSRLSRNIFAYMGRPPMRMRFFRRIRAVFISLSPTGN